MSHLKIKNKIKIKIRTECYLVIKTSLILSVISKKFRLFNCQILLVTTTSGEAELHRSKRSISRPSSFNDSAHIREVLEDIVSSSLKICHNKGNLNFCPRGRPGTPGKVEPKGNKGRKGKRGSQGIMGPPGRSGKQGIMAPPGIRGEKGTKGDIGPSGIPGIPGIKGEPGESISEPKVTISSSKQTVNVTSTASLLCSASGNPAAQKSLSRVNESLPSNRTTVTSDGLMQISNVRLEDAGTYKCLARNILRKDEKAATLIVQSRF